MSKTADPLVDQQQAANVDTALLVERLRAARGGTIVFVSTPPWVTTLVEAHNQLVAAGEVTAGGEAARIAFTLRLTPAQADQLDTLVLRLRRQLGRGRLDKAAVLLALVQAADASDEVRAAALGQLRG